MYLFALTIFTGAFLLFQVQPLMGKFILPWFGGSPAVWTTCLLFFQVMLLGGYVYAHLSARFLTPRFQAGIHLCLLVLALAWLPIVPAGDWKPTGTEEPTGRILRLLFGCLGPPYFVLSSTGPLLQEWFRRLHAGAVPYRLFALSNLGSLLALISFPFLFEPALTRQTQATLWSWGLGLFVVLGSLCAARLWRFNSASGALNRSRDRSTIDDPAPTPARSTRGLWFLLAACASVLLLAITNKLCQEVAVIPFLWVLPLGLYLLTFIICFDSPGLYSRLGYSVTFLLLTALLCDLLFEGVSYPIFVQIPVYACALFVGCMVCHGELYRLKPDPRHLTAYYLMIAAGGAAGGFFVAVMAPLLFVSYAELAWGLFGCGLLLLLLYRRDNNTVVLGGRTLALWKPVLPAVILLGIVLAMESRYVNRGSLSRSRTFYGVIRLVELNKGQPRLRRLAMQVGETLHGQQFLHPQQADRPISYYHEGSGVGLALRSLTRTKGRRIGVVGLGTGTLAAYGQDGDVIRFYEINPEINRLAHSRFGFLARSRARIEVILGDGRLSLEREPAQQFDLLALDAFSSDAIPVHLLTLEAFEIYLRHLRANGVLAVHVSNRHLNLRPVVERLATHLRLHAAAIFSESDLPPGCVPSEWLLVTKDAKFVDQEIFRFVKSPPLKNTDQAPFWTDEYTSLFKVMR
jgi:SAM-dependent methyltransferase